MVLRHVVLLKFKDGTADEKRAALMDGLAKLPEAIPEIHAYTFGNDAGLDPERNHDFAITADFLSKEHYDTYSKHPAHVELISNLVKPILAPGGRTAVQFWMGGCLAELPALQAFRGKLHQQSAELLFSETLAIVAELFDYSPKRFVNGGLESPASSNEGSCKVFSVGKMLGWSEAEVLASFGEHYRQVRDDPAGSSHGNIRAFMKHGWGSVQFPDGLALTAGSAAKRRKTS